MERVNNQNIITSAEEHLDLTNVWNLFRARVKSSRVIGRSDNFFFFGYSLFPIYYPIEYRIFIIKIFFIMNHWYFQHEPKILWLANWYQSGEIAGVKLPNLFYSVKYRNLLHWEHSIKHCYLYALLYYQLGSAYLLQKSINIRFVPSFSEAVK